MSTASIWIIVSWVLVVALTAINIVVFLQLKKASEQMMKMAFPGAKNMQEAMTQMQGLMGGIAGGMKGRGPGGGFGMPGGMGARGAAGAGQDAQLKQAMDLLANLQKKK